jgi:hypothetical protein
MLSTLLDAASGRVCACNCDLLQKVGDLTSLKVEFVEEVGWATLVEGLSTGR